MRPLLETATEKDESAFTFHLCIVYTRTNVSVRSSGQKKVKNILLFQNVLSELADAARVRSGLR